MSTLHLMYGLAGSGKSTHALRLQASRPALRFTLDEWMLRLFPDLGIEEPDYGSRAEAVTELIWGVATDALRLDVDVVLDWNFWSASRREAAVRRARDVKASVELHWVTTDLDEATARARRRAADGAGYFHNIDAAGNLHLASLMEPPTNSEGLTIRRV